MQVLQLFTKKFITAFFSFGILFQQNRIQCPNQLNPLTPTTNWLYVQKPTPTL